MFYGCYVDYTLVVLKPEDLNRDALNNFDSNLKFTLDTFNDVIPHILDNEIPLDWWGIDCEPTNTGQETYYVSFSPWRFKTAWITIIIQHATAACDETKIQAKLNRIKKLIAWNGFPKWIGIEHSLLRN